MQVKQLSQLLRAPGEGLLTIATGSGAARARLSQHFAPRLYANWQRELAKRLRQAPTPLALIGVPSDSGGGICRGAAHGPLALREALYARQPEWAAWDWGDVPCIPHLLDDAMLNSAQKRTCARALWGAKGAAWPASPLNILEEFLVGAWKLQPEFRPLVLGGDHSISGAVFRAMRRSRKVRDLAVLHFDAHTDLLEERYGVKECFGTWTSHALKILDHPQAWVQVGIRASGRNRAHWESRYGLLQIWAREAKRTPARLFAERLLRHWERLGCTRLYITNDIDGTDARFAPATGTAERDGLSAPWVRDVIAHCARNMPLVGADMMEVAPVLGAPAGARRTVQTAVSYLEALI